MHGRDGGNTYIQTMGGELEVSVGWLPWWQRGWGWSLDVGGHHHKLEVADLETGQRFWFLEFRYGTFAPIIIRWPIAKQGT